VRSGEVDLSLGVDQGGSGRIPAAFCGVVTVKGTHGLVPSWGITHIDHTIDFVTPLARTVERAALLLEVIAGADWRDAQWVRAAAEPQPYVAARDLGVDGLRIAVLEESANPEVCDEAVLANLEAAASALAAQGATVGRVSIPLWRDGLAMFLPYIGHLFSDTFRSEGQGGSHLGAYDVHSMEAFARARREEGRLLAPQIKAWLIADRWVHETYAGLPFALLHNARLALRRAVSDAFAEWDLLLTPTLPMTAPKLAGAETSFAEMSGRTSARLCYNTAPLNLTGHPSISVPSGTDAEGLPTAVQIVAAAWEETTAFRAAFAVERALAAVTAS
jgi:amidase